MLDPIRRYGKWCLTIAPSCGQATAPVPDDWPEGLVTTEAMSCDFIQKILLEDRSSLRRVGDVRSG